jgi:pyridoxal phosphate enzyme (YggS family)
MNDLADRLAAVRQRIREAELAGGRVPGSVRLIAVSKTHPWQAVAEAFRFGQRDFGENYLQEALAKQRELADLDITWHFIGPIQSNKTKPLAQSFQWVHSVDRVKIAERLNDQRPEALEPLNVTLQVNVSGEATKSGIEFSDLSDLAGAVRCLPRLRLRGLMAIPAASTDFETQRQACRALRLALESLGLDGVDQLSMGMSDDLKAAILEGATMVRIGTAIFGQRGYAV